MAHTNLPVLSSPDFPQVFTGAMERFAERFLPPDPPTCDYEFPESAGCVAGLSCNQNAVVHHLASEFDYCLTHFREVSRG